MPKIPEDFRKSLKIIRGHLLVLYHVYILTILVCYNNYPVGSVPKSFTGYSSHCDPVRRVFV